MNVLVTGVGAIIGYGIIESLKLTEKELNIIAVDVFAENYGKYQCDKFYQVPYTNDPKYEKAINEIILSNNIELVFPGIEQDVFYFNENHEKFNTKFILNKSQLIQLSQDKLKIFKFLMKNNFKDLIPTYTNLNFKSAKKTLTLPFIVKPKSSYASKGFHVINSYDDYKIIENEINESTLFQPYVGSEDEEYTISIFGDGKGGILDSLIMRRYLSPTGASQKTFVIKSDHELMNSVNFLTKLFKPIGPTNFQYRKSINKIYLLEINPRISSTCSIRSKFGYNDPLFCIEYFLENRKISVSTKKYGKSIRYIADKMIYE